MDKAFESGRDRLADDNMSWLSLLGRTPPGISMDQIRADLAVIAARIDKLHPGRTTSLSIRTATFFNSPDERSFLIPVASVILAAFALVLLIACANVANLLLARASVRGREIALRLSIGASRGRLVRQLLTESLLLSLAGGILGSLIAFWSTVDHAIRDCPSAPRLAHLTVNVAPNMPVLFYALLLTLVTGFAFGLVPALQSSRLDLNTILKGDGTHSGSGKRSGRLLLNTLVGSQVAVCMVLLLAAGLLLRGLYYAQTVNPGFDGEEHGPVFLDLGSQGYDEAHATAFMQRLRERIRALPGVVDVAQAECAPLSHEFSADHFRSLAGLIKSHRIQPRLVGFFFARRNSHRARAQLCERKNARLPESSLPNPPRNSSGPVRIHWQNTAWIHGRGKFVIGVAKDAQVSHLGERNTSYLYFPAGPADDSRTYVLVRYATRFTDIADGIRTASRST